MKTVPSRVLFTLLLLATSNRLFAQISYIGQFKVSGYNQTNSSPPENPDSFYFGVTLDSDPQYAVSLPMVFTPSSTTSGEFIMNQNHPSNFGFGSPVYSRKDQFDDDYPNGLYDYFTDYPDTNNNNNTLGDDVYVQLPPEDLYSTTIPAFSPASWMAMQNVDPAADFPLSWNSYVPMPGADYAFTFLGTYDNQTFNSQYGGFNFSCPPNVASTTIPAKSLQYGRTYIIQLFFSNRVTPPATNSNGSAVNVIIGFDEQTHTTLVTIPPRLQISPAGGNVTLAWPALASNYKLQTTAYLSVPTSWSDVTNAPTISGTVNLVSLQAANAAAFFRLAPR